MDVHIGTISKTQAQPETMETRLNPPISPPRVSMLNVPLIVSLPEISSSFGSIAVTLHEFDILVDASLNLTKDTTSPSFKYVSLPQYVEVSIPIQSKFGLPIGNYPSVSSGFNNRNIQIVIASSQNCFSISKPVVATMLLTSENLDVM